MGFVQGELGHDAANHVANVGHALADIFVGDFREKCRVFVERFVQGGAGVDVARDDRVLDFADEGRVTKEQTMSAEDGSLFFADLLSDAGDDGVLQRVADFAEDLVCVHGEDSVACCVRPQGPGLAMEGILKRREGGDHQVISVAEVQLLP